MNEPWVRRRTDTEPAPMRSALSQRLMSLHDTIEAGVRPVLKLAAETLERDEQSNAEMIDILVRAGYKDIPVRINADLIRRLIGYITPR